MTVPVTTIKPAKAQTVRTGHLSFAMFGQPYAWEGNTSANYDEFTFSNNRPSHLRTTYSILPGSRPHFIYRVDAFPATVFRFSVVNFLPGDPRANVVPPGVKPPLPRTARG